MSKITGVTEDMVQADPTLFRRDCFRVLWLLVMQRGGRAPCAPETLESVPKGAMLVMTEHGDGRVTFEAVDPGKEARSSDRVMRTAPAAGGAAAPHAAVPPATTLEPPSEACEIGPAYCGLDPQPPATKPHVKGDCCDG